MSRRLDPPDVTALALSLGELEGTWDGKRLDSDPILFPHRYPRADDREVAAFLASALAFGRVASIKSSLERLFAALGRRPAATLRGGRRADDRLGGFVHRWVDAGSLRPFLQAVSETLRTEGSLGSLFAAGDEGGTDYVPALDRFFSVLRDRTGLPPRRVPRGLRFLLPAPSDGSACKRAHLFLRWMVRAGGVDLGLWRGAGFAPSRLLLPMDTHVHRISRYLGLTNRPSADLRASREATAWLSRIDPTDPIRFDWALSRLGILAECVRDPRRSHCDGCAVRPVCRASGPTGRPPVPSHATGASFA